MMVNQSYSDYSQLVIFLPMKKKQTPIQSFSWTQNEKKKYSNIFKFHTFNFGFQISKQ